MKSVVIPVESLSRSPHAYGNSAAKACVQRTRFSDLPLPARLLLAVPRVRGPSSRAQISERYVLDTLGRIIDAGPQRRHTIEAVNLLAEALLTPSRFDVQAEKSDSQWLSATENLVLCILCKVRAGLNHEASELARHWLSKTSVEDFNAAATALCDSACYKQEGPHVFTPSWSRPASSNPDSRHRSANYTQELTLGELLLLNAIRLRMRTLPFTGINVRVVPMLREHLALPKIESLVDALLMEALQYSVEAPDIRCLCCAGISADEARLLAAMAVFSTADNTEIQSQLANWLPGCSVDRLVSRAEEFRSIVQHLGAAVPQRDWNLTKLGNRRDMPSHCQHVKEPLMFH